MTAFALTGACDEEFAPADDPELAQLRDEDGDLPDEEVESGGESEEEEAEEEEADEALEETPQDSGDGELDAELAAAESGDESVSGLRLDVGMLADRDDDAIPLTTSELSQLLMGGNFPITNNYAPNGVHAGIDFGSTGNGVTTVRSPVSGTVIANTSACGKVAIYDGSNTIILAHMSSRTGAAVNSSIAIGDYLGKASDQVGGGCTATGAHLHIEIRTGNNTSMANPSSNNTNTTKNPLTYTYSGFPAVALAAPASGASVYSSPVTFSWNPIQGASTYRLQVSKTNAFSSSTCTSGCVYDAAASTTSRSVSLGLGTHYWRVRAGSSGQGGQWSSVRSLTRK